MNFGRISLEKREQHSKKVSISKKTHYQKINELRNKENLSDAQKLLLKNEENRIKAVSQKSMATFQLKNNITGEEFIIISVAVS